MRLGIISDSLHHVDAEGRLYNHNDVLVRQFACWADLFGDVTVCAPLLEGPPPPTATPYGRADIRLLPVRPAGGDTLAGKLSLVPATLRWAAAVRSLLRRVDAVHVRCPNNISIVGLLALLRSTVPRQAVFTGTWSGYPGEPATYRWQRWFLKTRFAGPVAVYGEWPDQPPHIVPSFSPSYWDADWHAESERVRQRLAELRRGTELPRPIRLLTVGSLSKNPHHVVQAVERLRRSGLETELDILGDGPQRADLTAQVERAGLGSFVRIHGRVPHEVVRRFYRQVDFVVQAPSVEGYGKVPIEAFFHGAVPVLSNVNLSALLVDGGNRGRCFEPGDVDALARHIAELAGCPREMARLIENGRAYARTRTLEAWREHLREMMERHWGLGPGALRG